MSIPYLLEARLVDDGPVDEREGTPAAGGVDELHPALVPDLVWLGYLVKKSGLKNDD